MPLFRCPPARVLLLLVSLAPLTNAQQGQPAQDYRPTRPDLPSLFLVGDTAVRSVPGQLASAPLFEFFDSSRINLVDRTIDHRTTRSYITGGDWQRTVALIRSGDFVLFQFAENDPGLSSDTTAVPGTLPGIGDEIREVKDPNRPQPEIVHTYGWYLRLYIVETIARGAIPILCSQPPALGAASSVGSPPEQHGDWTRQIAAQQRVVFLDLASAGRALQAGSQRASPESSGNSPAPASPALLEAQSVVAALKGLPNDPLAGYFSARAALIKQFELPQEQRDLSKRSPDMPPNPSDVTRPAISF